MVSLSVGDNGVIMHHALCLMTVDGEMLRVKEPEPSCEFQV